MKQEDQAIETETEITTGPAEVHADGFIIEADEVGVTSATVMEADAEDTETEVEAVTLEAEEDAPIEIKVEEAGKPPARRLSRFDKRIKGKNAEIADATAEVEALKEQVKLYQLRDQQAETIVEPDEDTFDGSDIEFKAAQRAWNQSEISRIAAGEALKIVQQTAQNTTQESQALATDEINRAHYARADTLKVTNYDELEGNAVDIIGDDFAQVLISSTENAHRILASMGANPGKTAQIAALAKSNPSKAFADALTFEIHSSLKPASKITLDPETQVDPGRGISSNNAGLEGVTFS